MKFGRASRNESSVRVRHLEAVTEQPEPWRLPWPVASTLAALTTAAVGWLLVTGYCVLGWISVPQLKASALLAFSTQGWLLAHGISISLPGAQLSIIPLGLTAIIVVVALGICHQAVLHSRPPGDDQTGARLLRMAGVFAVVYAIVLAGCREAAESGSGASTLIGALIFCCLLPLAGFARALEWRPARGAAAIRTIGLSLAAGLLVMVAAGAAVVIVALINGRTQVMMIHDSLLPGGLGAVMLLFGQLAWLPNLILWGGSWAAGAGIQLGLGTVISPAQTTLGMLPSIPFFGAVPPAGVMPRSCLLWLLSSVLAGVAAALVLVRRLQARALADGRRLGIDVTAIAGALAGVGCGLVFTLLQIPAGGDLGSVRLTSLGARMTALLVMAPSTMGLAGMAAGAVLGRRAASTQQPDAPLGIGEPDLRPSTGEPDGRPAADDESAVQTAPIVDGPSAGVDGLSAGADESELPTTVVEDRSKRAEHDR